MPKRSKPQDDVNSKRAKLNNDNEFLTEFLSKEDADFDILDTINWANAHENTPSLGFEQDDQIAASNQLFSNATTESTPLDALLNFPEDTLLDIPQDTLDSIFDSIQNDSFVDNLDNSNTIQTQNNQHTLQTINNQASMQADSPANLKKIVEVLQKNPKLGTVELSAQIGIKSGLANILSKFARKENPESTNYFAVTFKWLKENCHQPEKIYQLLKYPSIYWEISLKEEGGRSLSSRLNTALESYRAPSLETSYSALDTPIIQNYQPNTASHRVNPLSKTVPSEKKQVNHQKNREKPRVTNVESSPVMESLPFSNSVTPIVQNQSPPLNLSSQTTFSTKRNRNFSRNAQSTQTTIPSSPSVSVTHVQEEEALTIKDIIYYAQGIKNSGIPNFNEKIMERFPCEKFNPRLSKMLRFNVITNKYVPMTLSWIIENCLQPQTLYMNLKHQDYVDVQLNDPHQLDKLLSLLHGPTLSQQNQLMTGSNTNEKKRVSVVDLTSTEPQQHLSFFSQRSSNHTTSSLPRSGGSKPTTTNG